MPKKRIQRPRDARGRFLPSGNVQLSSETRPQQDATLDQQTPQRPEISQQPSDPSAPLFPLPNRRRTTSPFRITRTRRPLFPSSRAGDALDFADSSRKTSVQASTPNLLANLSQDTTLHTGALQTSTSRSGRLLPGSSTPAVNPPPALVLSQNLAVSPASFSLPPKQSPAVESSGSSPFESSPEPSAQDGPESPRLRNTRLFPQTPLAHRFHSRFTPRANAGTTLSRPPSQHSEIPPAPTSTTPPAQNRNATTQTDLGPVVVTPKMSRPYSRYDYDRDAAVLYAIDQAMSLGDYADLEPILTVDVANAARAVMQTVAHKERTERLAEAEKSLLASTTPTSSVDRFTRFVARFVSGPTTQSPRPSRAGLRQTAQTQRTNIPRLKPEMFAYDSTKKPVSMYIKMLDFMVDTYGEEDVLNTIGVGILSDLSSDGATWFQSLPKAERQKATASLNGFRSLLLQRFQRDRGAVLMEADRIRHSFAEEATLPLDHYVDDKLRLYNEAGEMDEDSQARRIHMNLDPGLASLITLKEGTSNTIAELKSAISVKQHSARANWKQTQASLQDILRQARGEKRTDRKSDYKPPQQPIFPPRGPQPQLPSPIQVAPNWIQRFQQAEATLPQPKALMAPTDAAKQPSPGLPAQSSIPPLPQRNVPAAAAEVPDKTPSGGDSYERGNSFDRGNGTAGSYGRGDGYRGGYRGNGGRQPWNRGANGNGGWGGNGGWNRGWNQNQVQSYPTQTSQTVQAFPTDTGLMVPNDDGSYQHISGDAIAAVMAAHQDDSDDYTLDGDSPSMGVDSENQ